MDSIFALVTDASAPSLFTAASIGALVTLTLMEIVLGIDNIVFISILVSKLPKEQQKKGRMIGMGLALVLRLGLLMSISWVMGLTNEVIPVPENLRPSGWKNFHAQHAGHGHPAPPAGTPIIEKAKDKLGLTGKDLILLAGGIFLLYKASTEIYEKLEGEHGPEGETGGKASFGSVIFQIILLDLVFSLDSVITAVGMIPPDQTPLMVIAMLIAVGVMMASAGTIGDFVHRHPSVKILALSFLNLIGVMLLLEGSGQHINKGYIYSAMAFSLLVEMLNLRFRKKKGPPVELHEKTMEHAKEQAARA